MKNNENNENKSYVHSINRINMLKRKLECVKLWKTKSRRQKNIEVEIFKKKIKETNQKTTQELEIENSLQKSFNTNLQK